jgi:hypothetical protein
LAYVDVFPDDHAFEHGIARLVRSIEQHAARQGAIAAASVQAVHFV